MPLRKTRLALSGATIFICLSLPWQAMAHEPHGCPAAFPETPVPAQTSFSPANCGTWAARHPMAIAGT
jgi:hypothetical protein